MGGMQAGNGEWRLDFPIRLSEAPSSYLERIIVCVQSGL